MTEWEPLSEKFFQRLSVRVHELLCADRWPPDAIAPAVHCGPPAEARACGITISPGAVVVSGIALSKIVADQLCQLGLPLDSYSIGELEDAVACCAVDCTLIDDDEGVNFEDKLHMTEEKKEVRDLRQLAAEIGQPVRVLTMRTMAVADWAGTPADHRNKMESIRAFAAGFGPEPVPATH